MSDISNSGDRFKPGDRVRTVYEDDCNPCVVVRRDDCDEGDEGYDVRDAKGRKLWRLASELLPSPAPEPAQVGDRFEPGDRVRHKVTGKSGIIEPVECDPTWIRVNSDNRVGYWHTVDTEHVASPAPEPAQVGDRFEPGDRVRDRTGRTGTIDARCGDSDYWHVNWDSEPEPAQVGDKFKPGDRVRHTIRGVEGRVEIGPACDGICVVQWDGNKTRTQVSRDFLSLIAPEPAAPAPEPAQVGGDHYTRLAVQPWDALEAWLTPEGVYGYHIGCTVAYLARAKNKGGLEDLHKARHTLDRLIQYEEGRAEA